MKPHWTAGDFSQMARRTLEFTSEDIRMVNQGLAARAAAVSTAPAVAETGIAAVRGE